ncbi:MAG: 2-dehydro-3-deoxygalactonokinase [Burkholderiales bacterium]
MSRLVLTLDTGTSNTRVRAWRDDRIVGRAEAAVGVRDTARTGSDATLRAGIREAIHAAFATTSKIDASERGPVLILASGMITSGLGLLEIPHITMPANAAKLAAGMHSAQFADIIDAPIWFIPGVRHDVAPVGLDTASRMDMMRGEETEVCGLLSHLQHAGPRVVLLPGSHAKFVEMSNDATITRCLSTLSGELLDLLIGQSVLASGLRNGWPDTLDLTALTAGARLSQNEGVSRAAFSTRVLELFSPLAEGSRFSFLLGAILVQDLLAAQANALLSRERRLVVCGRPLLQSAYAVLARDVLDLGPVDAPDQAMLGELAGYGALFIARKRGLL